MPLYRALDFICNIIRSIPFLILLILLIPFTRLLVGQSYGSTATIVPLVVCAAPYIARVVEASLTDVDAGVIEAAKAMGASNIQIICKVLLVEAKTSLITGFTITTGLLLGNCRRRRSGRYRSPLRILQMADGYYGYHGNSADYNFSDHTDCRHENIKKT